MPVDTRITRYSQVSTALALLSDRQLLSLADSAQPLATGLGGTTLSFEVEGIPVFAKRIRLTDLELQTAHRQSTANLFELPAFCQSNVGSVGFGVWRELAAHTVTTQWVLSGQTAHFPMVYHWRVLPGVQSPLAGPAPVEWPDLDSQVAHWEGSDAMRQRLQALSSAQYSVLIVMEQMPWCLHDWLEEQWAAGPEAAERSCALVEQGLLVDLPNVNALGLLHGDAHFGNILTDGQRLYFADLGLASHPRFDLSVEERAYLAEHASLDRAYALSKWVKWLTQVWGPEGSTAQQRNELIRAVAAGRPCQQAFPSFPPSVARIVERHALVSTLITDFYVALHNVSRRTSYPQLEVEAALKACAV